ncbi:hypothetical protein IEQ34_011519 [Dendrobium chrysotoxum]|uniref:Uncharacterized protein n=1 Tax=Dendrobium chrysotoxum TaxID=161865 RepID=A0AAV7GTW2_DENCH|nr:hypothetical protein IEQ34_011519 [Dendrobium chrysotoxum]
MKIVEEQLAECKAKLATTISGKNIVALEAKNHNLIAEKEASLLKVKYGSGSSRVIKDFKKSLAFKTIIQDHIQEARDNIYNMEQCIDEGFIQDFLKGVHLVQCKTIVKVKGLTHSQASNDSLLDPDWCELEREAPKLRLLCLFAIKSMLRIVRLRFLTNEAKLLQAKVFA